MTVLDILAQLVAFPSITDQPNKPIVDWIETYLRLHGCDVHRIAKGEKAGLFARIGPQGDDAVLLSAHCDVVPVAGQSWTTDPFTLAARGGRLYGRGVADMKGFLAVALAMAGRAGAGNLSRGLCLSISYDEEIGCQGIAAMADHLIPSIGRPALAIVGEPTRLRPALGHKGKAAYRAICTGQAGHSAMAPRYQNALHLAADFLNVLRAAQAELAETGARDAAYDTPYATVHAGQMQGGVALNMVPDRAEIAFEIRHLAQVQAASLLAPIAEAAARLSAAAPDGCGIVIETLNAYPGLEADMSIPAIAAAAAVLSAEPAIKVSYGTEAGFFAALGIPTLVWGPGDMAQGHQPDEFIEPDQLRRCEERLIALLR